MLQQCSVRCCIDFPRCTDATSQHTQRNLQRARGRQLRASAAEPAECGPRAGGSSMRAPTGSPTRSTGNASRAVARRRCAAGVRGCVCICVPFALRGRRSRSRSSPVRVRVMFAFALCAVVVPSPTAARQRGRAARIARGGRDGQLGRDVLRHVRHRQGASACCAPARRPPPAVAPAVRSPDARCLFAL